MQRQFISTQSFIKKIMDRNQFHHRIPPQVKNIELYLQGHIATATINTHNKPYNMITRELVTELKSALETSLQENKKVLTLQSGKDDGFVVGADVNEFAYALTAEQIELFSSRAQSVFHQFANNKKISIVSVINGHALGGGAELAWASDYRIGRPNTKLGQPEIFLGVIPAFDAFQRLTSVVGPIETARQIISGEVFDARQAFKNGLLDKIVTTQKEIDEFIMKVAERKIIRKPQASFMLDETKLSLKILHDIAIQTFETQLTVIQDLRTSKSILHTQANNICIWLNAVKNARVTALDVSTAQLEATSAEEKSKIEREAFSKIALTPCAKFAMRFWLLDKNKYKTEHEIVNEHLIKKNLFYISDSMLQERHSSEEQPYKFRSLGLRE